MKGVKIFQDIVHSVGGGRTLKMGVKSPHPSLSSHDKVFFGKDFAVINYTINYTIDSLTI